MIHLDTHVVLWLAQRNERKLGSEARRLIMRYERRVSPVALLELGFMQEIGRLKASPDEVLTAVRTKMSLSVSEAALSDIVTVARGLVWTRDPFDRLITANAMVDGARLATTDQKILENFKGAVWD